MSEIKSALLTRELVEEAFKIVRPEIEKYLSAQTKYIALCLVVLDPTATVARVAHPKVLWHGTAGEEDTSKWNGKTWPMNAIKKATLSWRTGFTAQFVKAEVPHLYEAGDFKYGGSAVVSGIVVGASGFTEELDAHFAERLGETCYTLVLEAARAEYAKPQLHILETEAKKDAVIAKKEATANE